VGAAIAGIIVIVIIILMIYCCYIKKKDRSTTNIENEESWDDLKNKKDGKDLFLIDNKKK